MEDKCSPIHGYPRGRIPGTNQSQNEAPAECGMVWGVTHAGHPGICFAPCRCGRMHAEPGPLWPWGVRKPARLFPLRLPGWLPWLVV